MKKIVLGLLGGLVAASAVDASPFKGVYLGAGLGLGHAYAKSSHFQRNNLQSYAKLGDESVIGSIHLGHGILSKNMYFGLEVQGSLSNYALDSRINSPLRTTYKSKYNWGASIRPGALISPNTLLYVSFGANQRKVHYRDPILLYKANFNRWTPSAGFGMETALKGFRVGLDVSSDLPRKVSFSAKNTAQDNFKVRFGSTAVTARFSRVW